MQKTRDEEIKENNERMKKIIKEKCIVKALELEKEGYSKDYIMGYISAYIDGFTDGNIYGMESLTNAVLNNL